MDGTHPVYTLYCGAELGMKWGKNSRSKLTNFANVWFVIGRKSSLEDHSQNIKAELEWVMGRRSIVVSGGKLLLAGQTVNIAFPTFCKWQKYQGIFLLT